MPGAFLRRLYVPLDKVIILEVPPLRPGDSC